MANQLQIIEIHLWVLTGLLTVILLAAGYCNYSRVKEQAVVSPYHRAKDLWEREQFVELHNFTTAYLKERPNTANVLMYDALVAAHFEDYDRARRDAEKMLRSPDHHKLASTIIEFIEAKTAPLPS